jgi:Na+-transporting NADH:ubiquinone oxidoreductase subunit NqrD
MNTTSFFLVDIWIVCTATAVYTKREASVAMSIAVIACHRGNCTIFGFSQLLIFSHSVEFP